ncbi:MAG: ABC transporter substrate-binding protein [bacterium]
MRRRRPTFSLRALLLGAIAGTALGGCAPEVKAPPDGVLVVSVEQTSSWVRNFNPLSTATTARWPTVSGVYEPLFVFNSVTSERVPWLAVGFEWREDGRVARVTTREGVEWSDGAAFDARDVHYTFELMREQAALDRLAVWRFLEDVRLVDNHTVDFRFQRVFIPGFDEIAAQPIVPRHVWSRIEDPVTFANESPVGTGPFTEVRAFRNQVYEIGRNPYYWREGEPKVDALRFPAYPGNDRANLALVFDEVDWAANFIPAIDRVYVARDPEHHRYWFPLTGSPVFLYANTTRAPFDDRTVREAMSRAIDRELLVDVAAYRYSRPSDPTALSDAFSAWRDADVAASVDWTAFDAERAGRMLDSLGAARGEDGIRRHPDGSRWKYEILTVSGWSDWVRAAQVIARGYQAIGIDASVRTYDFAAWFLAVQRGEFDLAIGWSNEGPTPYVFYRGLMSAQTFRPVGEIAGTNWHRFSSPAADSVFAAFERETDPVRQHELVADMQRIFAHEIPAIPLYPNPSWAEYNTRRFVGFPSADDPYADPSPNKFIRGETLLSLTTIRPRED